MTAFCAVADVSDNEEPESQEKAFEDGQQEVEVEVKAGTAEEAQAQITVEAQAKPPSEPDAPVDEAADFAKVAAASMTTEAAPLSQSEYTLLLLALKLSRRISFSMYCAPMDTLITQVQQTMLSDLIR